MSMAARSAAKSIKTAVAPPPIEPATVVGLGDPGRVVVRVSDGEGRTRAVDARLAEIPGYRATAGDRVLVAHASAVDVYVVAVIHASTPPAIVLPDGSRADMVEGALELRDRAGRLLVRYADGAAEVSAPSRDLTLSAPNGAVVIQAATDVTIEATRDLAHHAGRRLEARAGAAESVAQLRIDPKTTQVTSERLHVDARSSRLATGEATLLARTIATTAESLAVNVGRYELEATRIVEKARDAFRDVADLLQQRIGRARVIVDETYTLHTQRTVMESKDETTIDGKKILIG
jgi:hypothetical protein